jgi:hypothetical protein
MGECTAAAIKAYFVNGTLPTAGTVCQAGSKIFGALWSPESSTNSSSSDATPGMVRRNEAEKREEKSQREALHRLRVHPSEFFAKNRPSIRTKRSLGI